MITRTNAIKRELSKGTRIISFMHNGKKHNVTIGSLKADPTNKNSWGTPLNRAVVSHSGYKYLVGIDNNDEHKVKRFRFDRIKNLSIMEAY